MRVLSPNALLGFKGDQIWVFSGASGQITTFTDPLVLSVIAEFRQPALASEVLARHPAAGAWIAELERIGVLVDPGDRKTAPEPAPGTLVSALLSPLAVSLDRLAGALAGIGPEVAESIRTETGVGLEQRMVGAVSAIMSLEETVRSRVPGWIERQLRALELPQAGLSIHLGSGSARLPGWVNIDVFPAELSMDFRWGLPFADGSAERVYLSHVLEHLYYPGEVRALLAELHRVLAPDGRVRIVVPDIEACIEAYVNEDDRFFEGRKDAWPHWKATTRLERFLGFAGVGPYAGMFGLAHKWGYDLETVSAVLSAAGFRDAAKCAYQGSVDPKLRVDDASTYAKLTVDGRYYSLFVEAIR